MDKDVISKLVYWFLDGVVNMSTELRFDLVAPCVRGCKKVKVSIQGKC